MILSAAPFAPEEFLNPMAIFLAFSLYVPSLNILLIALKTKAPSNLSSFIRKNMYGYINHNK